MKFRIHFIHAALLLAASCSSVAAEPVADFYRGRTVTLLVGFPPGGGYDTNIRMLGRHIGRFIPGEPMVTISNMHLPHSRSTCNRLPPPFFK